MILKKKYLNISIFALIILSVSCRTSYNSSNKTYTSSAKYKKYSEKLGVKLSGNEDIKFIEELASWLNTPYRYGGTTKKGTDCSGFVMSVYQNVYGIKLFRSSYDQQKNTVKIKKKNLETGDLIFFVTFRKKVSHVGIYITNNKFIHASSKRGVCVSDLEQTYYVKHYHSCGRIKK